MINSLLIQKKDKELIEGITEWNYGVYCIRFKDYDDAVWCKSKSDIYMAIEQFKKTGAIKTNDAGEVVA